MKTRTKIQRAMKTEPLLTDFGLGLPYGTKHHGRKKKLKEEKTRLLNNQERFEVACTWLQGIEKTESINTRHSSYFLKHITERRSGIGHISNGVLIAAAIHCGFTFKISNGVNALFNMDQDSIQAKYEESLLYEKYPKEISGLVH